jgi:hypothetical protein
MAASPSAALLLPLLGGGEQLACLCDLKQAGGQSYFRLSDQRVLVWLRLKVDQAKAAMQASEAAAFRCCWLLAPPFCLQGNLNHACWQPAISHCCIFMLRHAVPAVQRHGRPRADRLCSGPAE